MTTDGHHADLAGWIEYLKDIGVRELAVVRPQAPPGESAPPKPSTVPAELFSPAGRGKSGDAGERLRVVRDELGDCTRCKLASHRTNLVFGVGNPDASLMFVGEGPGADEDRKGEPFVGRAGKKLDEMILSIGLTREEVYIANVVKCRPPDNRTPEPDEVQTCSPFLFKQIEAIAPRVIVALGAPAAKTLLGTRVGITRLRGNWGSFRGVPVMPTFHPAYLLRAYTTENRRAVWSDLKAARARIDGEP